MSQAVSPLDQKKVADALKHSWVYHLPEWIWPYAQLARWERPIGWQLLMWPCFWSAAIAFGVAIDDGRLGTGSESELGLMFQLVTSLILFLIGSVAMRGAGCTYNDIVDREIDDKVARTRSRPLPSGRVTAKHAWLFLVLQSLVGLVVLVLLSLSHMFTFALGVASLTTVAIYPFMKRITWWPQLFLGLAFSWGALMGWATFFGEVSSVSVILYLASILWVIGYDTIYAHQDIEDDALVGVKSTARLFADNTKQALVGLYGGAILLFGTVLVVAHLGWIAWLGLAFVAIHMGWQIWRLELHDPAQCLRLFKSNSFLGAAFFIALLVSALV